jgi:Spy/CpxP family protein refolding chaperone
VRDVGGLEQALRHGDQDEEGDEQADAAIGDAGAGESHGEDRPRRSELLAHESGDGFDRAAVVHQLAEQGAEQKERKELRKELRGP